MTDKATASIDLAQLDKLEALAKAATPGPWTVLIDGTCSGAWPHINTLEVDEYGDPYTVAELSCSHVETDESRNSGGAATYVEEPWRFEKKEDEPVLDDAAFIAAANPATVQQLIALARRSLTSGAPADTFAVNFIERRAEQYLQDHADTEPDTGALVFRYGEAGRDYHSTLVELADEIRAELVKAFVADAVAQQPVYGPNNPPRLRKEGESVKDYRVAMGWDQPGTCTAPPLGWKCTRAADHEGPCAAIPVHDAAAQSPERVGMFAAGSWDDKPCESNASAGAAAKSEQAPMKRVGWFVREGGAWVATSSDDPRATILYRSEATAAGAGSAQPRAEGGERAAARAAYEKRFIGGGAGFERYFDGWQDRSAIDHGAQAATTASASGEVSTKLLAEIQYALDRVAETQTRAADHVAITNTLHHCRDAISGRGHYGAALASAPLPAQSEQRPVGMVVKATFGNHHILVPIGDANKLAIGTKVYAAPAQPVDDARDAARLDWIDQRIAETGSVWILPSGESQQFVQLRHAGHTTNYPTVAGKVREAIDAAMRANDSAAEGGEK